MPLYQLGSIGGEVKKIQTALQSLGFYLGPIDGVFGDGTLAAVKAFQKKKKLKVDGIVGPITWKSLFQTPIAKASLASKPIAYRCLALTTSFETGSFVSDSFSRLSGDFDGQGLSFGILQWNVDQGTLQSMLKDMLKTQPSLMKTIFHSHYIILVDALKLEKQRLLEFVRSIQHPITHSINEPWRDMLKALGRNEAFQAIQLKYARRIYRAAQKLCLDYGLWSERAAALMFDIRVQNGGISKQVRERIMADIALLPKRMSKQGAEVARMEIIATRRAEAANPVWIQDVRARKMCIAKGYGIVHSILYDLEQQFGIGLKKLSR